MREANHVRVRKEEGHVGVAIIDTVEGLTLHELSKVVLDDGALGHGGVLSTGGLAGDAVTEGEHVLELLVLESVGVHVDESSGVSEASLGELSARG